MVGHREKHECWFAFILFLTLSINVLLLPFFLVIHFFFVGKFPRIEILFFPICNVSFIFIEFPPLFDCFHLLTVESIKKAPPGCGGEIIPQYHPNLQTNFVCLGKLLTPFKRLFLILTCISEKFPRDDSCYKQGLQSSTNNRLSKCILRSCSSSIE